MNSAPHLLTEDRPEFERVLDKALLVVAGDPAAQGHKLNARQLRTMAMSASAAISACAAGEYDHYQRMREQQRATRPSTGPVVLGPDGEPLAPGAAEAAAAGGVGGALSGAGLFPVVAVLTPLLAGTAALIFLIVGYLLAAMSPEPAIASPLRTAGWLFLAIAGAGILFCTVGMVLTALRDGSSAIRASHEQAPSEVSQAREAWSAALLERGMLPFLQEALASNDAEQVVASGPATGQLRSPAAREPGPARRLGYSRPGFSSPGGDEPGSGRPSFSSPDFSSPDFSGPEFGGPHDERI